MPSSKGLLPVIYSICFECQRYNFRDISLVVNSFEDSSCVLFFTITRLKEWFVFSKSGPHAFRNLVKFGDTAHLRVLEKVIII